MKTDPRGDKTVVETAGKGTVGIAVVSWIGTGFLMYSCLAGSGGALMRIVYGLLGLAVGVLALVMTALAFSKASHGGD